jgi:hypothetical protein
MIIPQSELNALPDNPVTNYKFVAIHHTACPCQTQSAQDIATEEIPRGYTTIPYNFVIDGDGKIMVGRPIDKLPAATGGMNTTTLAICLEGDFQSDDVNYTGEKPSDEQIHAAITIINEWLKPKCLNLHTLISHSDASVIEGNPSNATACCGNLLRARLGEIRAATGLSGP